MKSLINNTIQIIIFICCFYSCTSTYECRNTNYPLLILTNFDSTDFNYLKIEKYIPNDNFKTKISEYTITQNNIWSQTTDTVEIGKLPIAGSHFYDGDVLFDWHIVCSGGQEFYFSNSIQKKYQCDDYYRSSNPCICTLLAYNLKLVNCQIIKKDYSFIYIKK